ncbi:MULTISPECIES: MarR family winged helix-turn-helix transcriptional regulator [Actinomadura]|uniref:MarR family transcriptional regulator n=1 Tax=Actinomadura litoris TaxID=2678616 RepID=A0A7K1KZW1_9ACTN|nr:MULTISPECIES: MarR family transcriptional regulator [Actinomadura]MBT2211774.1 MarR family transcriptional regulator [Actinomadura sp. NEAU-AAG7]MUN37731.1 MarR family transcriptional regulator [Actinomadura litoris]
MPSSVPRGSAGGSASDSANESAKDIVEIERALTRVAHMLTRTRQHDRFVAEAGVPVERAAVPLLRTLAEADAPMRPSELAARLAVEAPHVTRQIQRLERVGYVRRVPDPGDGRAYRVELSDAGLEAFECIRAAGRRWVAGALAEWSPGEREQLAGLVHRMLDDFEAHRDRLDAAAARRTG